MARETNLNPAAGPVASPHDSRGVAGQSFAINGTAAKGPAARKLRHGIGGLLADAIELVELQVSLVKLNAHQAGTRAIWPLAFLSAGAVLALASLPILLIAVAYLLHDLANLPEWAAFGITFLVCVLLGGLAAYVAVRQLASLAHTFDDSGAELSKNLTWLKSSLRQTPPETPTDRQRYDETLKDQWERRHAN